MALHKNMFELAKKDKEFLADTAKGPKNALPDFWANDVEIACWATAYYGYLLGKYGINRAEQMRSEANLM